MEHIIFIILSFITYNNLRNEDIFILKDIRHIFQNSITMMRMIYSVVLFGICEEQDNFSIYIHISINNDL